MLNNLDSLADADPQVLLAACTVAIQKAQAQAHPVSNQNSKTASPRLLTVKQTAEYLGRTVSAIRQLIYKRKLPVIRIDRAIRIDVQDLDRLIDEYRT